MVVKDGVFRGKSWIERVIGRDLMGTRTVLEVDRYVPYSLRLC